MNIFFYTIFCARRSRYSRSSIPESTSDRVSTLARSPCVNFELVTVDFISGIISPLRSLISQTFNVPSTEPLNNRSFTVYRIISSQQKK